MLCFIEQVAQADDLATASLERSAILTKDGAKPNVVQLHRVLRFPARVERKELLKMELLPTVGDVDDFAWLPTVFAMLQRGQIGGGVVCGAIAFLHHRGMFFQRLLIVKIDYLGPFTVLRYAADGQLIHHALQSVVVKTLAQRLIELDLQSAVNLVKLMP